jgi:hypothetical protein
VGGVGVVEDALAQGAQFVCGPLGSSTGCRRRRAGPAGSARSCIQRISCSWSAMRRRDASRWAGV